MTQVFRLADLKRRCKRCHRIDCEDHCVQCGKDHDHDDNDSDVCLSCEAKNDPIVVDDDNDLWQPPVYPADVLYVVKHYRKQR